MNLEVGKRYFVFLEDCCIEGTFEATLREASEDILVFNNGVALSNWMQVQFTEVSSETQS